MDFAEFVTLDASTVAHIVADTLATPLGVGIPFNGTRRWYMATFDKSADDIYSADYLEQVFGRMRSIMGMMFADGVHSIFTPVMGFDLAERGEEYMTFGIQAIANIAHANVLEWYTARRINAACYGQLELLPDDVGHTIAHMQAVTATDNSQHFLRFGVFADHATEHIITLTCDWCATYGTSPTAEQLIAHYYHGAVAPLGMWIGSDQPTVFDVPLVWHGNTALYFLQYPTLYLDHRAWRRLLYDILFVRGDQETLYPDNIASAQHIMGLGMRQQGGWMPSTT